jgi:transcriptional regulator of acetoin/glycerol metabolism
MSSSRIGSRLPSEYLLLSRELEDSYNRCRSLKLVRELIKPRILSKTALSSHLSRNLAFLVIADQAITRDYYGDLGNSFIYILCDMQLVTLKTFSTANLIDDNIDIKPGTVFTEESCGTNALALAREHNRLVAVIGEQHYCHLFKEWTCIASPVRDGYFNSIGYLGLLIRTSSKKELPFAVVLQKTAVRSIERESAFLELVNADTTHCSNSFSDYSTLYELTSREKEILKLLAYGFSNADIATKLSLSVETGLNP